MIPFRVVSLRSSAERRAHMSEMLGRLGVAFSFFDGVDGRQMSDAEIAALAPQKYYAQLGRPLTAPEIGVAASFNKLLKEIAAGSEPFVAVAEDDAEFSPDVTEFLRSETLRALPVFDALKLYVDIYVGTTGFAVPSGGIGKYAVHAPIKPGNGCVAQIFSKEGAAKIVAQMKPLRAPFDNLIYRDVHIVGLRVLEVTPALATFHAALETTIGPKTRQQRTLVRNLRRKFALLFRNIRALHSFIRAWGLLALFRLRYRR
jgi:glycosyl transferase family 25